MPVHPPSPGHQLAEVNIARLKAPVGSPVVAPFIDALDRVNAVADRPPGFVWRHRDGTGNATATQAHPDPLVIYNASTWEGAAALETFVWGTVHARFYHRRGEWFDALGSMHFAMWWVPPGTRPTPEDAMDRLVQLESRGPSERAFGWADLPGARLWRDHRCPPLAAE